MGKWLVVRELAARGVARVSPGVLAGGVGWGAVEGGGGEGTG